MSDIPKDWIPLNEALEFIDKNFMFKDSRFVLDNFDYKYTMLRIDMRTGDCLILPGVWMPSKEMEAREELSRLRGEVESLKSVLGELCYLKRIKHIHGKTEEYLDKQPRAWKDAFELLEQLKDSGDD